MSKLNFGSGNQFNNDWTNVDKEDFGQPHIGSTELFADNSFELIVAHASLQINDWHSLPVILKELRRILKPEGVLRISLPNIVQGFQEYLKGNIEWFPNDQPDLDIRFSSWATWFGTTKTLLTVDAAIQLLMQAGFARTVQVDFRQSKLSGKDIVELDTRKHEFFFIESMK